MELFNIPMEEPKNTTSISPELLRFLEWLFEHEQDTLRMLIKKSLRTASLHTHPQTDHYTLDEVKEHLSHLCSMLEALVQEGIEDEVQQHAVHQTLIPAINRIDASQFSPEIIAKSLEKIPEESYSYDNAKTKTIFCKALLRNWNPSTDRKTSN